MSSKDKHSRVTYKPLYDKLEGGPLIKLLNKQTPIRKIKEGSYYDVIIMSGGDVLTFWTENKWFAFASTGRVHRLGRYKKEGATYEWNARCLPEKEHRMLAYYYQNMPVQEQITDGVPILEGYYCNKCGTYEGFRTTTDFLGNNVIFCLGCYNNEDIMIGKGFKFLSNDKIEVTK